MTGRDHSADASTHGDRKIHAWMEGIAKEIPAVYIVNIDVVSVEPSIGPRVNHGEPKAAIFKTSRSAQEIGAVHVKRVATAKAGTKAVVGNPPMALRRLCRSSLLLGALLLLRRLSRLLCALLLLRWLSRLLCALLLLCGFSWLLRALLLLCGFSWLLRALLLRRSSRLLCLLLLLRRLSRLLRALRLLRGPSRLLCALLLLRRFRLLLGLLLLALCVSRSNGSGNQE